MNDGFDAGKDEEKNAEENELAEAVPEEEALKDNGGEKAGKESSTNKFLYIAIAALLVIALVLSAFGGVFNNLFGSSPGDDEGENSGSYEEIADGDPERVLVEVNGEEITEGDFWLMMEQEKQGYMAQGIDLASEEMEEFLPEIEASVLERLIGMILLQQEAAKEGFAATEDDIDERFQEYAGMFGGEEDFVLQMESAGMSMDDLKGEIERELSIELFLAFYISGQEKDGKLDVSDEEAKELYGEYEEQIEEDFEDIKDDIILMIKDERENELIAELVEELREKSEINYLFSR